MVGRGGCCLHPSECGLRISSVETRQHTLGLNFLELMCTQEDKEFEFWKEDVRRSFPSLESVYTVEANRSPQDECSFEECRSALRCLLQVKDRLSDTQALSPKALYHVIMKVEAKDKPQDGLGLMN